ncbi:hypothetical protein GYA13_02175 [Candidatus Kuenenbacteria bacterium]|nr:hypothetical protein [Candidatus Kuenenbacteria bacterium]
MIIIFILILSLLVLHIFGMQGLYYSTIFYDKILHLIGGLTAGLISIKLCRRIGVKNSKIKTVLFVLMIGILWEAFEFAWDRLLVEGYGLPVMQLGLIDTLGDLFFDLFGVLSLLIIQKMIANKI